MAEIILNIKKKDVYNEVAKISSYVGAKSEKNSEDTDMYARVFATDSDREMLDRFWEDCCGKVAEELQRFIVDIANADTGEVSLAVESLYNKSEKDGLRTKVLQKDLFSCFVNFILYKWFELTERERTEYYFTCYKDFVKGVKRKLSVKYTPVKREYDY